MNTTKCLTITKMKDKIIAAFGKEKIVNKENITSPQIHVIDLTQRSKGAQSIVIYEAKPPNIDTLLIENPNLNISVTFFKPQCFRDVHEKEPENCEGVFYLTHSTDKTWVLFIEIKDCKATNIADYFQKAKKQIITTVQLFRDKKIIAKDKRVFANISFPSRKTDFFNQLLQYWEPKNFLDNYNIFIRGTNKLKIKDNNTIY